MRADLGSVVEARDYYAFGMEMAGRVYTYGTKTKESYTGHERDAETGLLYAGARYYDSAIGRWLVVDPLAEQFASHSPYNYVLGNPLSLIDPDGRAASGCPMGLCLLATAGGKLATTASAAKATIVTSVVSAVPVVKQGVGLLAAGTEYVVTTVGSALQQSAGATLEAVGDAVGSDAISERGHDLAVQGQKGAEAASENFNSAITAPYRRPSGATTRAQRAHVQGRPCVDCGAVTPTQHADHKTPLVVEYYENGTIDRERMRDTSSVQPQCPSCSNSQGGKLSRYSREKKKEHGLD